MLNKVSSLFLTGVNALDALDEIKLCTKYKHGDKEIDGVLPAVIDDLEVLEP